MLHSAQQSGRLTSCERIQDTYGDDEVPRLGHKRGRDQSYSSNAEAYTLNLPHPLGVRSDKSGLSALRSSLLTVGKRQHSYTSNPSAAWLPE